MKTETKDFIARLAGGMLLAASLTLIALGCIILGGCSPRTVHLPQERVALRTDTVTEYISLTDSVFVTERVYESDTRYDSIAPILDSLNRVIGWDRYHFRELAKMDEREMARMRAEIDSLRKARTDTVRERVPYPVVRTEVREVEKPLGWWQTALIWTGAAAVAAVAIAALRAWIRRRTRLGKP